ncbi:MAG: permease-like cell division protein FtsX [Saprospiraceae bacterium]|nr:permease-like cell division protein FtsX [Saprospiraceae bacterium]MDW8484713.1 permease-like cell division protein FtsX [Saprospiraceae bacterium]
MPRSRPTYIPAIISMAMVLLLAGLFALIALHGQHLIALFKERVDVWLEFKPDIAQDDLVRIIQQIRQEPFVKPETVTYITREQAAASMRTDLGDESLLADLPNMMRDIVRFHVKAEYFQRDSLLKWREALKQDSLVAELYVEAVDVGNISRNLNLIAQVTLWLALASLIIAVVIIYNTVRLALYANRFIIKNQELVGASWEFITRPYLQRALLNGLFSSILAIALLIALLSWAYEQMPELKQLQDLNGILAIFIGLLTLGILLSGVSTYLVVRRFLRMKIDDLY